MRFTHATMRRSGRAGFSPEMPSNWHSENVSLCYLYLVALLSLNKTILLCLCFLIFHQSIQSICSSLVCLHSFHLAWSTQLSHCSVCILSPIKHSCLPSSDTGTGLSYQLVHPQLLYCCLFRWNSDSLATFRKLALKADGQAGSAFFCMLFVRCISGTGKYAPTFVKLQAGSYS